MLLLNILLVSAVEKILEFHDSYTGRVGKVQSAFERIYLPETNLLFLEVHVKLDNLDGHLEEYPKPKPKAWGRFDGVPNEKHHDFKLHIEDEKGYLIRESFPKKASLVVVRIDGGLLDELHFFNAYSVRGYKYTVKVKAFYCSSERFTVLPWEFSLGVSQVCDVPVVVNEEVIGYAGKLVYVPELTAQFRIITDMKYSISPDNFQSNMVEGNSTFLLPKKGFWYLLANFTDDSELVFDFESCSINGNVTCLNQDFSFLSYSKTFHTIPSSPDSKHFTSSSLIHISVPITEDALKYRYAVVIKPHKFLQSLSYSFGDLEEKFPLCKNSKNYCEKHSNSLVAEIGYPILGDLLVTAQSSEAFSYSIFRTKLGDSMCHSQPSYKLNDIVYYCYCGQNTAGFYCQKDAISYSHWVLSVMLLTLSNLTMLVAVVYGIIIKAYVEATAFAANMIASYIYHWCDEQYFCFGFTSYALRTVDFILSFNSVCVSIVYMAKLKWQGVKFSLLLTILIVLTYLGLGTDFNMLESTALPIITVSFTPVIRWGFFIYQNCKTTYGKLKIRALWVFFAKSGNFRGYWVAGALGSLVAALISRAFEMNYTYYITHSFWHVFIMLSAFCVLRSLHFDEIDFKYRDQQQVEENTYMSELMDKAAVN